MDLGVISTQLEVAESLNMNDIIRGGWYVVPTQTQIAGRAVHYASWHPPACSGANTQVTLPHFDLVVPVPGAPQPDLQAPEIWTGQVAMFRLPPGLLLPSTDGILTASAFPSLSSSSLTNHSSMPHGL